MKMVKNVKGVSTVSSMIDKVKFVDTTRRITHFIAIYVDVKFYVYLIQFSLVYAARSNPAPFGARAWQISTRRAR